MIKLESGSSLWVTWSRIAVRHEAEAWAAREAGDLPAELEASLVAATSAAVALEALYYRMAPDVIPEYFAKNQRSSEGSSKNIKTRLAHLVQWSTRRSQPDLKSRWEAVLDLRNRAAHPPQRETVASLHPTGTYTSAESATFHAEAATESVDTLVEVLRLITSPVAGRAAEWARRSRGRR